MSHRPSMPSKASMTGKSPYVSLIARTYFLVRMTAISAVVHIMKQYLVSARLVRDT